MKLHACIVVFALLCSSIDSHSDEPGCTAGFIVMTKEEIRREIREQFTSTCVLSRDAHEIVTNICAKMEGLIQPLVNRLNALHQPGKSPGHPAVS